MAYLYLPSFSILGKKKEDKTQLMPVTTLQENPRKAAKDIKARRPATLPPGLVKSGRPATTLITLWFPYTEAKPSRGLRGGAPPKPNRPLTRADTILKNSRAITGQSQGNYHYYYYHISNSH